MLERATATASLRLAAIAAIAAWLLLAPAARQLAGSERRWLPAWDMYAEVGLGIVRARFYAVDELGQRTLLDRHRVLGRRDPRGGPLTTLRGEAGVLRVARELCGHLGPGVKLQIDGQIATWSGWEPLLADADDLCRPLPPRPHRPTKRHG